MIKCKNNKLHQKLFYHYSSLFRILIGVLLKYYIGFFTFYKQFSEDREICFQTLNTNALILLQITINLLTIDIEIRAIQSK